jgi:hypothetical protein
MPARVQPLNFPMPDGLERLRRDRRGSAVAFPAGTRHPQNPPDTGSQAVADDDQFKPEGILAAAAEFANMNCKMNT